jgi:hypothetical protein
MLADEVAETAIAVRRHTAGAKHDESSWCTAIFDAAAAAGLAPCDRPYSPGVASQWSLAASASIAVSSGNGVLVAKG